MDIDMGDTVLHGPTRETWCVAAVENDRLYWMGYPFGGSALLSDCTLIEKATEEEKAFTLKALLESGSDARPAILARERQAVQP